MLKIGTRQARVDVLRAAAVLAAAIAIVSSVVEGQAPLPIFDAHLHYNAESTARYPVPAVLDVMRKARVTGILATSRPNDGTRALVAARPADVWVVPFVRPYIVLDDVQTWFKDPAIHALIQSELKRGYYKGIGEFHIYGADAKNEGVRKAVDLAVASNLYVYAHADEEAIEALFAGNRYARVIWAHTGFGTPAARLDALLQRYPALWCEMSYFSGFTDGSVVTSEWRKMFEKYGDRFLVGSDTWVTERFDSYPQIMADYRSWLAQLPRATAEKIAFRNAEALFRK